MHPKDKTRWLIAQEAARIMAEEGIHDFLPAKQKAAARLGVSNSRGLPRNEEVELALEEHHRLYRAHIQPQHIARLRTLALEAMRFLSGFAPRLVGGVLDGSAGEFSPITLHLFPEAPEDVIRKLMDGRIPFEERSVSVAVGANRNAVYPGLDFFVDGTRIELWLLPPELKQQRMARRDKAAPKGSIQDVEALVGIGN
jgi:hypothetical protein